ncbi:mannose permease IID component [Clostridium puniceum]|uniref:Mannose permease IID component n=1 Tax=Clostridium puniceum TaxID=29367 RepID=A0A1S8TWY5_9CLOT|nr:PTS system mannose/fructose/sorbose family transporter subunit IID [Clostridium puniceum]OOM82258.1 mannose permease IID component [Clostridium puniceum]
MSKSEFKLSRYEKKMMRTLFWRQNFLMTGINYIRMQGMGYAWTIKPLLKKIYKNEEEYYEALKRNSMFFNTTPQMVTFIMGLTLSMEEENANSNGEFDTDSINAVKVGLMGPFAGLGDSFFSGTLRIIATGIGLGLAQAGNILGPILFLLVYNIPGFFIRYYGGVLGYKLGSKYIREATESGLIQSITKAASIMGLMMIGSMSYQMVKFSTTFEATIGGTDFELQKVLDSIMIGVLPLSAVLVCFILLSKRVKPMYILFGIIILGLVLTLLGVCG